MARPYIYYDLETTGLSKKEDVIVEIAALDINKNREFVSLVNPGRPIPSAATTVHHISDDMVKDAPSIKEALEAFLDFCPPNAVLIAHNNLGFDKWFLEAEAKRAGVSLPLFLHIDSLKWVKKYRGDLPNYSLQFLREFFGIPALQAHRALDDVRILAQVFELLIGDLGVETVAYLLDENKPLTRMPFGKYKNQRLDAIPQHYRTWLLESGILDKEENAPLKSALVALTV